MIDIFGKALAAYQSGNYTEPIITLSSLDEEDEIPVPYLFRSFSEMPFLEQTALKLVKGTVLDVGCCAGSHSLYLQKQGVLVTALDESEGAITTCKARGIKDAVHHDFFTLPNTTTYDTLLLLMNGIGIAGTLKNINTFFNQAKQLLNPGGQLLLDSSDIIYMYEAEDDGGYWIPNDGTYYGEVTYTLKYKNETGTPFSWLYIDYNTLQRAAIANGFACELVAEGEHYDYLAKLTLL